MIGLPELNERVKLYPRPGRRVQMGPAPVDVRGGGRFYPEAGAEMVFTEFELEQLRHGDLLLHEPHKDDPLLSANAKKVKKAEPKKFDHAERSAQHIKDSAPKDEEKTATKPQSAPEAQAAPAEASTK